MTFIIMYAIINYTPLLVIKQFALELVVHHMVVPENGGDPKSSILYRMIFHSKLHPFWGCSIYGVGWSHGVCSLLFRKIDWYMKRWADI